MSWPASSATLGPFFGSEAMAAIFSDRARIQAMLDVEAALARAEAACGIIPASAVGPIAEMADAGRFDLEALGREALNSGNLAVPLVKHLTALVAGGDAEAARWVHWGSTSQDIADTGLVLQMRRGFALIDRQLTQLCDRLADLAEAHAATPMIARTLMQQAIPTTLGLKLAGWLSGLSRARDRLSEIAPRVLVLQCGGAAGNLAALHPDGPKLADGLGAALGLPVPDLPWHTQRDRVAEAGCGLALTLGCLGKLGRDLSLMAQTEIGEFREPGGDGRGGSSAMPHKANPVACARIIAAATRAPGLAATLLSVMDQEHERGLGGWQAEWEVLPELFRLTSGALEAALLLAAHGTFDPDRLAANLGLTRGLVMAEAAAIALGRKAGKAEAHRLIGRASQKAMAEHIHLRDALAADPDIAPHITAAERDALFAPENHLGAAPELTLRAVAAYRSKREGR
ncbi:MULTISPECIES: 3-carboxy-cis,cis-muconate cycloisomerase [Rhodomicrobium]|uniref:3-carboxy-cis,cis-muconate cycloisomerase n=1 Tax=Rhodomicrobium TaxID=1068 RepID=UPI000B4B2E4F|nr:MULTISPECIES: 3-carboxy-cis,cis-muconate cycloisomerase [Rhodomicrobium]